jgi:hypothetical protein
MGQHMQKERSNERKLQLSSLTWDQNFRELSVFVTVYDVLVSEISERKKAHVVAKLILIKHNTWKQTFF